MMMNAEIAQLAARKITLKLVAMPFAVLGAL
jgi:hypothetical protein